MRHLIFTPIVALALATPAWAHSHLESADPKANAVLDTSPQSVSITFEEAVREKESSIRVADANKHVVNDPAQTSVSQNRKTLTTALPELSPGTYTVDWKAVCMCTDHHMTKGHYQFSVK